MPPPVQIGLGLNNGDDAQEGHPHTPIIHMGAMMT